MQKSVKEQQMLRAQCVSFSSLFAISKTKALFKRTDEAEA